MPSYWDILEQTAAARREREFQAWRESRYTDDAAFDRFLAAFVAANRCRAEARRRA